MNLALSSKHVVLGLGLGVVFAACGDPEPEPTPTAYTWTKVSTDIKSSCASVTGCHLKGTTQPFSYDKALPPGQDMANYTSLMTANLIDKTNPAKSVLIVVGGGGNYAGNNNMPHSGSNLSPTQVTNWTAWITAGATF